MNTKPKLAYIVRQEDAVAIVFASNPAEARRWGAAEIDSTFEAVNSCCRAKDLDQYAHGGFAPDKEMIENHGLWVGCRACYDEVSELTEEKCFDASGHAYCSPVCLANMTASLSHK